jgi:hypothetical protein
MSLISYEYKRKCSASEKISGNRHIFVDNCWTVLNSLLLADGGNLGISQQLSNTIEEFPRAYLIAFGHFGFPIPFQQ